MTNKLFNLFSKFTVILAVAILFLMGAKTTHAQVSLDTTTTSHANIPVSEDEGSFGWSHTAGASPEGVVVFVYTIISSTPYDISVDYGASAMTLVSGGTAVDTGGEAGVVRTYFLGSSVPTSTQTITVTRTNNSTKMWAVAFTVNAAADTEVYTSGIVLLQENQDATEQSVDDGSPGVNSLRFAALYSGHKDPMTAGTNSTLTTNTIDYGNYTSGAVYETAAGPGSRLVGLEMVAADDVAAVHLAVREVLPTYNFSGIIYQTNESSPYLCSTSGNLTVYLRVNGSGSYSDTCDADSGAWQITGVTVTSGQTIYVYTSGGSVRGNSVLVSNGTTKADVDIFQDRVILRDDVNGSITNTEVLAGNTADGDDLITTSGTDVTVAATYETHIYTSDTYAPGANVETGKLHVVGNYSGAAETLTLTGSGTGTSRPLYVNGGSFATPDITTFQGTGTTDIEATTFDALNFTPTITGSITYTFLGAETINGNFTVNPDASSSYTLTVNLGGTTTVGTAYTTSLTGTTSGESTLDTTSGSSHSFSTGLLNIAALGGLTANNSTITLTGTSGTLFTYATGAGSGFTAGSSTVVFNPNASVTLFSGSPTLYNLSLTPSLDTSGKTYTVGAALTINGDFTINPDATALLLTVNMGGNITVAAGKTTTITRTSTATSSLVTTAADYNLSTGFLNIATGGTLNADSSTSTITLTGTSGTLFTLVGTFTAGSSTVVFNPNAPVTLFSTQPTLYNLSLTPSIDAAHVYTVGSALTINNDFIINPSGSAFALTVNLGGTTTITTTGTTTIQGSGSATSNLNTTGSNHILSTGLLDIDAGGTLTANNSAITLTGTAGTLFTRVGTFTPGGSTVTVTSGSGTPTLNSGTISFNNLTINASVTITTSGNAITVTDTLDVTSGDTLSLFSGQNLTISNTLTLSGEISGAGTMYYTSSSGFPSTGTYSAGLRIDGTNGNRNITDRGANGYGGGVEIYSNSGTAREFILGNGATETIDIVGNLTLTAAGANTVSLTATLYDPTVVIDGNISYTGGDGSAESITTSDSTGDWTVGGNVNFTNGSFTATTGNTFIMSGASKTVTSNGQTFQNFVVKGSGSPSISSTDAMDIDGSFTLDDADGAISFTHGDSVNLNIAGNILFDGSATFNKSTGGTVIFDGDMTYSDQTSSIDPPTPPDGSLQDLGDVQIDSSPATTNLVSDFSANSLTVVATNYFNTCEYEVDIGNGNLVINGTMDTSDTGQGDSPCSGGNEGDETWIYDASYFTVGGTGSFTQDQSTLVMDNPSATDQIDLSGESLYNLTVSPGGTTQFANGAIDIDNNLYITTGTLDMNGQTVTIGGSYDNDAVMNHNNAAVTFNADTGTELIDADGTGNEAFYDVTFDQGTSATWQLTTALEVDNSLTITDGTLDVNGSYQINVGNNWNNAGGTFTASTGTVVMDAQDAGNTLSGTMTGSSSFNSIDFDDSGNSGAWLFNADAAFTDNFDISGGTVTAPSSGTLTIAGDFTNDDGFTHNNSTVVFNDSGQDSILLYSTNTTFYGMTISTATKQMKFDQTERTIVSNNLTIQGTDCDNLVYLDSDVTDNDWEIDVTGAGTVNIDYADIEDSTAITTEIVAENSTEVNEGNTNWDIQSGSCGPKEVRIKGNVRGLDGVRIK